MDIDQQFFGEGNHNMSRTDSSSSLRDPFYDKYERPVDGNNIYNAVNNTVSGASRMIATTTEMVNGRKHIITKIIDANGTRIIEDYGDGRKRVTLNGKEEVSPDFVDSNSNQQRYSQSFSMSTRPFTSSKNYSYIIHRNTNYKKK